MSVGARRAEVESRDTAAANHEHQSARRLVPVAAVLSVVAVLAAACGGGALTPGVASLGSTTTTAPASASSSSAGLFPSPQQVYEEGLAYAGCMRSHGVADYPNPTLTKQGVNIGNSGAVAGAPRFKSANSACRHYLPNGGGPPSAAQVAAITQRLLKFAVCMRSHGVANFPDPIVNTSGGKGLAIGFRASGLDPSSPQYATAQRACGSVLPGRSTGAQAKSAAAVTAH